MNLSALGLSPVVLGGAALIVLVLAALVAGVIWRRVHAKTLEQIDGIPTLHDKVSGPAPTFSTEVAQAPRRDMTQALIALKAAHDSGLITDALYEQSQAAVIAKELGLP